MMAQLIKLQNYISRYQWDLNRYSKQYMKVKNEHWDTLYKQWKEQFELNKVKEKIKAEEELSTSNILTKLLSPFKKEHPSGEDIKQNQIEDDRVKEIPLPKEEIDLKHYFLNKMYPFQLKWASSTIAEKSFLDERYMYDSLLKYLLQRFPDNIFIMYEPIFEIKNAPVEMDTIIISPIGIEILHFIEPKHPDAVLIAGDDRTWTIDTKDKQTKIISPVISVKRSENVIKSIFKQHDIKFDLSKTIISRKHQIIHYMEPYKTNIVDYLNYDEWFQPRRKLSSPLKSLQLKAAETLLQYTQTTAFKRPEWNDEEAYPSMPPEH